MEKEIALQRQSQQFQLKMVEMMNNIVSTHHSSQSLSSPMSTSTQYPHYYSPILYDDDLTQV